MARISTLVILPLTCLLCTSGCQKQAEAQTSTMSKAGDQAPGAEKKPIRFPWSKTYDGPFGLAAGIPVSDLEDLNFKPAGENPAIFIGTPPNPVEGFSAYVVLATPKAGVCRIQAKVDVPTVNGSGDQIKAEADRLAEVLRLKYGPYSTKSDYSREGVYDRYPHYWMMGLKEESVIYAYHWNEEKSKPPLPHDLSLIIVNSAATSSDSGYVSVQYTFKNTEACIKELDETKAKNL